jgi:hypothetical protein
MRSEQAETLAVLFQVIVLKLYALKKTSNIVAKAREVNVLMTDYQCFMCCIGHVTQKEK